MRRLLIIVGVLLVTLGVCAPMAQAQSLPHDEAIYQSDTYRDYGSVSYLFRVVEAPSAADAEALFIEVTEGYIDSATEQVADEGELIHVGTAIVPNVGDASRGFTVFVLTNDGVIEHGIIFVQEGNYVYAFFSLGFHGAYLDLCDLTMYYFMVYDREDGDLPPLELMPDGFQEVHGGASI